MSETKISDSDDSVKTLAREEVHFFRSQIHYNVDRLMKLHKVKNHDDFASKAAFNALTLESPESPHLL